MRRLAASCVAFGALLTAAACGSQAPTAPSANSSLDVTQSASQASRAGANCVVDVGATTNPLPALHELATWLNEAIADPASSLNCGEVRSLDAKLENIARHLDVTPPGFVPACGTSSALTNELESLIRRGALALPPIPPPFPGGPTNVFEAAQGLRDRWCAAARGDIQGPRS